MPILLVLSDAVDQDRTDRLSLTKAMKTLFFNSLAGLFSGVETAFTDRFRLGPTACADQRRISADISRTHLGTAEFRLC